MKTKPYPYQEEAIQSIVNEMQSKGTYYGGLLYKPGRGKTLTSMTAIERIATLGLCNALVIVAPKSVLGTWEAQLERHGDFPEAPFRWDSIKATTQKWKDAFSQFFNASFPIFLVNVEAFQSDNRNLEKLMGQFEAQRKTFIIVDESSKIKGHKAYRTKNLIAMTRKTVGRMILTGAPVPNSIVDIYSQFEFLKTGFWREKSFWVFEKTYTVKIKQRVADGKEIERTASMADVLEMRQKIEKASTYNMTPKNEAFIQRLIIEADDLERRLKYVQSLEQNVFDQISDFVFYADRPEGLPDNVDMEIIVELSADEKRVYKEFKNELMSVASDGELLSVKNRAGLLHKFRQIAGGSIDRDHSVSEEMPSKLRALIDDIEDHNEPVIILSSYVRDIEIIAKALDPMGGAVMHYGAIPQAVRDENLRKCMAGEVRFLVGNHSTVYQGIDGLQHRYAMIVNYCTPMKPEEWEQSRARIDRQGQERVCVYKHLIAKDTIDRRCMTLIQQKQDLQGRFETMSKEELLGALDG
jgi:superfamily II DNA or RNA helicase